MTPEQRLDRLERIAKLFVTAGLRARRESREHDNKINHLVDLQIRNEERQKRTKKDLPSLRNLKLIRIGDWTR